MYLLCVVLIISIVNLCPKLSKVMPKNSTILCHFLVLETTVGLGLTDQTGRLIKKTDPLTSQGSF
jgi:hypothetical protein